MEERMKAKLAGSIACSLVVAKTPAIDTEMHETLRGHERRFDVGPPRSVKPCFPVASHICLRQMAMGSQNLLQGRESSWKGTVTVAPLQQMAVPATKDGNNQPQDNRSHSQN